MQLFSSTKEHTVFKVKVASQIDGQHDKNICTIGVKVDSLRESERRVAQIGETCRGGLQIFAAHFWHTEGWSADGSGDHAYEEYAVSMVDCV